MCIDANAGARRAARQRNKEKHANFQQKSLMFFNKETSLARAQNRNVIGYSRDLSDAYVRAIYTQGKGRLRNQQLVADYFSKKKIDALGGTEVLKEGQSIGLDNGVYQISNSYIIVQGNKIIERDDVFASEN